MDSTASNELRLADEQRERRLQRLGLNSPEPEEKFDRIATLASSLADAPIAMVNFIGGQQMFRGLCFPTSGQKHEEHTGIPFGIGDVPPAPESRDAPIDIGFCPHVVRQKAQLAIEDVLASRHYRNNPVVEALNVRAYLGTPLKDNTGLIIGTVTVADVRPHKWTEKQKSEMQFLADTLKPEFQLRDSVLAQQDELLAVFDRAPFPMMLTQGPDHLLRFANTRQGSAFGRAELLTPAREAYPTLRDAGVFDTMDWALQEAQVTELRSVSIPLPGSELSQRFDITCTPVRLRPDAPVNTVLTTAITSDESAPGSPQQKLAEDLVSSFANPRTEGMES
ncbi:GAF domain-containing protein [Streptomyces sp. Amel2xB2]|uniref:GAF domain-containing protein n=1 Tax=Streptomyces sp. Amel2xB2 TaxID=1305829 RepID=UPI000DB99658|nr:GAF domain-containing protein [Streptomyces sp. Amel2xB2]RAJ71330.1 GAF domain-containing protein [Streptomyces sp. Amel2xB2]